MNKNKLLLIFSVLLVGCGSDSDSTDGELSSGNKEVINREDGIVTANIDPSTGEYDGSPAIVFDEYADVRGGIVEHRYDLEQGEFIEPDNSRMFRVLDSNQTNEEFYNTKTTIPAGIYGSIEYMDDAVSYTRYSGFFRIDDLKGTFSTRIPEKSEDLTIAMGKNKWTTEHRRNIDNANSDFIHVLFDKAWINETASSDESLYFLQSKGSYLDGYGYENIYFSSTLRYEEQTRYSESDTKLNKSIYERADITKILAPTETMISITFRVENSVSHKFDQCWLSYSDVMDTGMGQCYNDENFAESTDSHHTFYVDSNKFPVIDQTVDMRHTIREFLETESGYIFRVL